MTANGNENNAALPMARCRVGLLGASGETGSSILKGLIESGEFVRYPYNLPSPLP